MSGKLVAVAGATGRQGGCTLEALLKLGFRVRALTRNPSSDSAKALASKPGVEVVKADFDDLESLKAAFAGADAVFAVTDFWVACGMDPYKEKQQGINLVDAAKAANVRHYVWSTLEDTREALKGLAEPLVGPYTVPHFDAKGEVNEYAKQQLGSAVTSLYTSIFYENLLPGGGMTPTKQEDGSFSLFMPVGTSKLAWCSTPDIGNVAAAVIATGPEKYGGKDVAVTCQNLTLAETAQVFSDTFGAKVVAVSPPQAVFVQALIGSGVPEQAVKDLANMFMFFEKVDITAVRPVEGTKAIYPEVQDFKAWLADHKAQFEPVFV